MINRGRVKRLIDCIFPWALVLASAEILFLPVLYVRAMDGIPLRAYNLFLFSRGGVELLLMPPVFLLGQLRRNSSRYMPSVVLSATVCELICFAMSVEETKNVVFAVCQGGVSCGVGSTLFPAILVSIAIMFACGSSNYMNFETL